MLRKYLIFIALFLNLLLATPVITTNGGQNFVTKNAYVILRGTCESQTAKITVNDSQVGVAFQPDSTSWSCLVGLNVGNNGFVVKAFDDIDRLKGQDVINITFFEKSNVVNLYPTEKLAGDNTGETISEIINDDAISDPSKYIIQSDNMYTIKRGKRLELGSFDINKLPATTLITAVDLHLQYGTEKRRGIGGYTGDRFVQWRYNTGRWQNTSIKPVYTDGTWSVNMSYDLYAVGVDSVAKLQNINFGFRNNSGWGTLYTDLSIDYLWLTVGYILPPENPAMYPQKVYTNENTTIITGSKDSQTTAVNVWCNSATVGQVTYPTLGTWQVEVSDLAVGENIINIKSENLVGVSTVVTGSVIFTGDSGIVVTKSFTVQAPVQYIALGGNGSDPVPGATITVTNTFKNEAISKAEQVYIEDQVPNSTSYKRGSAISSRPAIITFQHAPNGDFDSSDHLPVTALRWQLIEPLKKGQTGSVVFEVTIN